MERAKVNWAALLLIGGPFVVLLAASGTFWLMLFLVVCHALEWLGASELIGALLAAACVGGILFVIWRVWRAAAIGFISRVLRYLGAALDGMAQVLDEDPSGLCRRCGARTRPA